MKKVEKCFVVLEVKRDKDRNIVGISNITAFKKKTDAEKEYLKGNHNQFQTKIIETLLN